MTVVLVEMGVARGSPYRFGRGEPPRFAPHWPLPALVAHFRGRLEACLLPGGRCPPDPDCMWRWGMEVPFGDEKRDRLHGRRHRGDGGRVPPVRK